MKKPLRRIHSAGRPRRRRGNAWVMRGAIICGREGTADGEGKTGRHGGVAGHSQGCHKVQQRVENPRRIKEKKNKEKMAVPLPKYGLLKAVFALAPGPVGTRAGTGFGVCSRRHHFSTGNNKRLLVNILSPRSNARGEVCYYRRARSDRWFGSCAEAQC